MFDLDGTLLDRDTSLRKFVASQYDRLQKHLLPIAKDQYVSRFIELDNRGYVWKDQVYQTMLSEMAISGLTWEELLDDYLCRFPHHCVPFPGLHPLLQDLQRRQVKLGVITNGRGAFQMANIRALGIESFFTVILVSEWEGISKPDAKLFGRALHKLGVAAERSVYIGDHPHNDVYAAKQAGMKAIWKKDPHWPQPDEADGVIAELPELLSLISQG